VTAPATPQGPSNGAVTPERRALAEALDLVRQKERDRRDAPAPEAGRRVRIRVMLLVVVALGSSYVLAARPPWLFPRPPIESAAVREASLRMTLFTTAKRIEAYRIAHRRLPDSLAQIALPVRGVTYHRDGDVWRLDGISGTLRLALSSQDSLDSFVGSSYEVLSARGNP
jgi:hypothetical protein